MRISDWSSDVVLFRSDRERFVAHDIARAPHRMAQPQRLLLADIGARAGLEPRRLQHLERFAALLHHRLQLEGDVAMLLDRGLVAAGHENHLLAPRLARSAVRRGGKECVSKCKSRWEGKT